MNKKTRIITLGVLAIMIVICISLGITRAFMRPLGETSSVTEVALSSCAKISLTDKNSINLSNTYPMSKNRALQTTPYTFTVSSSCETFVGFNLYLAIPSTNTLPASDIHYIITNVGSKEIIADGILSAATNATSSFTAQEKTEYEVGMGGSISTIYQIFNASIPYQGETSYDLYLYLDENATQATNGSKTFTAAVAVKAYDREKDPYHLECDDNSFACTIAKKYTDGSNGLYYHNSALINGANDSSYRYSGSYDATQNWVCFGHDDDTKAYAAGWCDAENLYRIIGVFDSIVIDSDGNPTGATEARVKLIKAYEGTEASLGTAPHGVGYKSDTYYRGNLESTTGYAWGSNTSWMLSTLNTNILNGTYLTKLDEAGSAWTNKIATTEWKIGGNSWDSISSEIPATGYRNEVLNTFNNLKANLKIGLMYASDYGFAASPANWNTALSDYGNDTNRYNNWLFIGIYEWTISPQSDSSVNTFNVYFDGHLSSINVSINYGVRPSFYLNSDVSFAGGSGTSTDPYRIA